MPKALTQRQKKVLDFLRTFMEDRGYPPVLRDICAHLGIKAPKNAAKHLDALERKGFITRTAGAARAIAIAGAGVKDVVAVPIVGRVRAGAPHLAIEDVVGHVTLDRGFFNPSAGAFLLRVEGDSMTVPGGGGATSTGIEDGDHVLVRPQKGAENGEVVVAIIDNEATIKRFFRRPGGLIVLRPDNPSMEPLELKDGDGEVSIVGKVVSVIKRLQGG